MKTDLFEHHFIPGSRAALEEPSKIMIVMHGLGDSLIPYKDFCAELNVTGINYLLINAPYPYYIGHSWFDIETAPNYQGLEESRQKLITLIDEVIKNGFLGSEIFVAGFSQGARMSMEALFHCPHKLGGIIALSPRLQMPKSNLISENVLDTPVFMAHGEYDAVIPFKETKAVMEMLKDSGLKIDWHEYDMEHEIDPMEMKDLREWINQYI